MSKQDPMDMSRDELTVALTMFKSFEELVSAINYRPSLRMDGQSWAARASRVLAAEYNGHMMRYGDRRRVYAA